ncbi:MAG: hypothetical protein AAF889_02010 [Cyanobacteria bacterium P01_D01_bin.73]
MSRFSTRFARLAYQKFSGRKLDGNTESARSLAKREKATSAPNGATNQGTRVGRDVPWKIDK